MAEQGTFDAVHVTLRGTASAELGETGEELNGLFHQALLTFETPSETEMFFRTLRRSLQSAMRPEQSDGVASFLKGIVSEEEASDHQQGMKFVAEGLARDFERRKQLFAETVGVKEVEELLGLKRQSVNERWKKGKCSASRENKAIRFPVWQFDSDADKGVLPGLDKVLAALRETKLSTLNQAYWLTSPKPQSEGLTVEALKDGMVDEVAGWAYGAGVT